MEEKNISEGALPLISVIVPVYRVEEYLDECVSSLVQQTYPHLEILLIDDGSPDRCPAMCDAWAEKDARIRVIHSENHGVSHARNLGLEAAKGELIGFADADDWCEADWFERMYHAMQEDHSEIVEGGCLRDTGTKTWPSHPAQPPCAYLPEEAYAVMFCPTDERAFEWAIWDKLYQREMLEGLSFDEKIIYAEDMIFCVQAFSRATRISYRPLFGYHYRIREGSATAGGMDPLVLAASNMEATSRAWNVVREASSPAAQRAVAPFFADRIFSCLRPLLQSSAFPAHAAIIRAAQGLLRAHEAAFLSTCPTTRRRVLARLFLLPYPLLAALSPLLRLYHRLRHPQD